MKNNFKNILIFFAILTVLFLSVGIGSASDNAGLNDVSLSHSSDDIILNENQDSEIADELNSVDSCNSEGFASTDSDIADENSIDAKDMKYGSSESSDSSVIGTDSNSMPKYGLSVIPVVHTGNDAGDIQTAINTATDGDIVDLGSDEYVVDYSQLNITKAITFRGDGENTIIRGYGYMEGYGNSSSTSVLYVNSQGVTIEGIQFINIDPNLAYTDWDTLFGWAVKISASSKNVLVNNCSFINYNHGIYSAGRNTTITNSYFNGTTTRLFTPYNTQGKERGTKCIHLDEADNCLIANNVFEGPVLDAILLEYGCDYVRILDNKFINNSYSIYLYGEPGNDHCIIANNTFNECGHFEDYDFRDYSAVFNYLPIIDAEETYLSNLLLTENEFCLRNATRVLTTARDYVAYIVGGINITNNKFEKVDSNVNPSSIFLLDVEAGLIKELTLSKPIIVSNNELIDGMYAAVFFNYDDHEVWSSYFGDLIIPISGQVSVVDFNISDSQVDGQNTVNIAFKDENSNNLSGDLVLTIFGENSTESYPITINNGIASQVISCSSKGNYTAYVSFSGNSTFYSSYLSKNFTVSAKKSNININLKDINSGESPVINISLYDENYDGISGVVVVNINNKNYNVNVNNGFGQLIVNDSLTETSYLVTAIYDGDNVYDGSQANATLNIIAKESNLNLFAPSSIVSGDTLKLNITLTDLNNNPLNASVFITVNNKNYQVEVNRGKASIDIDGLVETGVYAVTAVYYGDQTSINSSATVDVEVLGRKTTSSIFVESVDYDQYKLGITLNSTSNKPVSGSVSILIDGKDYKIVQVSNGGASFNVDGLNAGSHIVQVLYYGDSIYLPSNASMVLNVSGSDCINVTHTGDDLADIQNAIDNAKPGDTVNLGFYNYADISSLNITKDITIVGEDTTVFTAGNNKPVFNIGSNVTSFNLSKVTFKVSNGDIIVFYDENKSGNFSVMISISDVNLEKLSSKVDPSLVSLLTINSTSKNIFENGLVLSNNNLESGMRTLSLLNTSAIDFNPGSNSSVVVNRISTKLVFSNMKTTAINSAIDGKKGAYFSFTLKDSKNKVLANKKVKVVSAGKTYTLTTNSKGVAKIQINYASAGTYALPITYIGDNTYLGSFAVAKITVVKQKPKLIASAKKFKVKSKTKTVTATLKTSRGKVLKNKKIKFTVKGKTYTGTTNSKGVAKIKLSLTKKGTYTCTIKNVADSTYKAVTKKIKIRIV